MLRLGKTGDVGMVFKPIKRPTIDAGAVAAKDYSIRLHQALLPLLIVRSLLLRLVLKVKVMEALGIVKHLFNFRACSMVCRRGCAEVCGKGGAIGFIPFLVQATQLAQKNPSAFVKIWIVEWIVSHLVLVIVAFCKDQK